MVDQLMEIPLPPVELTSYFKTISVRFASFSASSSSVQSFQNVTTESAAPDTIVRSSELTANAHT